MAPATTRVAGRHPRAAWRRGLAAWRPAPYLGKGSGTCGPRSGMLLHWM